MSDMHYEEMKEKLRDAERKLQRQEALLKRWLKYHDTVTRSEPMRDIATTTRFVLQDMGNKDV